MQIKVQKLRAGAHLPERATQGSAGFDLRALCEKPIEVQVGERTLIPTGIAIELPGSQQVGLVFARSGLALKQGISLANGVGVIDSDYRGEVGIAVINHSDQPVIIQNGQRIAQLLILSLDQAEIVWAADLSETEREDGGFGSTGLL